MAFKANTQDVAIAYAAIKQQARATKVYLQTQVATMQQPTCDSVIALSTIQHFGIVVGLFAGWSATPGLAQYARDQENDQAYNVVAEYTAMNNAMVSARDSLISMFPKDGNGFLLYQTLNAQGQIGTRTFTAAQLASVVTLLNNVIATIA
jgi:hypothetical protein